MKIDIVGWTKLVVLFSFLYSSCSHLNLKNDLIFDFYKKNNLVSNDLTFLEGKVLESDDNHIIYETKSKNLIKIFKTHFENNQESLKHLMSRQVSISALFRDLFEPYYGLVQKKKCVDLVQFNTDLVSIDKNSKKFSVIIPVDQYLNPFDCDLGEPALHVQYTFLSCERDQTIFEIRQYKPVSEKFSIKNIFNCSSN